MDELTQMISMRQIDVSLRKRLRMFFLHEYNKHETETQMELLGRMPKNLAMSGKHAG